MSEPVSTETTRRTTVGLVGFAASFLAVIGITIVLVLLGPARPPIGLAQAPQPSPTVGPSGRARPPVQPVDIELTGRLDWLPARVTAADGTPPPLPEEAVGPAALVLPTRDVLVMPNGSTYQLPSGRNGLSPDGRWLVTSEDNQTVVRDLTRTTVFHIGPAGAYGTAVWSRDGRQVALDVAASSQAYRNSFPSSQDFVSAGVVLVDLSTGRRSTVDLGSYPNARLAGLDDDGTLVIWRGNSTGHTVQFWTIDGATGEERSHASLDLTTVLTPSELESDALRSTGLTPAMPFAGTTVLLWTTGYDHGIMYPGELLAVDVAHGLSVTRLHLPFVAPEQVPAPQGGVHFRGEELWRYLSTVPEGILLSHDGDAFRTIELLDPATGKRTVISNVDDRDPWLRPRGAPLL